MSENGCLMREIELLYKLKVGVYMYRMIFCDVDGTLLTGGDRIDKDILNIIKRLTDKGMLFSVASGRPYSQLKPLFGEIWRQIIFICLDGAIVMHRDCVLYKKRLCRIEAGRLLALPKKAEIFGRNTEVVLPEDMPYDRRISEFNRKGDIFKLALYGENPQTGNFRICYNRDGICEYVNPTADKGAAARAVMEKFSVNSESAAAIGDGENDLPLLLSVGAPYRTEPCATVLRDRGFAAVSDVKAALEGFLK